MSDERGFRSFVDRVTPIAAIITAVAAVGIAVYEARITREQQKKSVWPYVMQYNTYSGQEYLRYVENVGLGPAIVSSFEIRVGDSTYTQWRPVVDALTGSDTARFIYSSFGDGSVLKAGDRLDLLRILAGQNAARFAARRSEVETVVCYCSLYGDCWTSDSEERRPKPVDSCG